MQIPVQKLIIARSIIIAGVSSSETRRSPVQIPYNFESSRQQALNRSLVGIVLGQK